MAPTLLRPHTAARSYRVKNLLLLVSALLSFSLLIFLRSSISTIDSPSSPYPTPPPPSLSPSHLLFSIASSSHSLPSRAPYLRLWHAPISHLNSTFLFLDRPTPNPNPHPLPPIIVPQNATSSPQQSPGHRIARIVKHAVALDVPGVHWYVFGDDDTVFFVDNLVRVLSKYDHTKWYYVGYGSESYEQNEKFYFGMAFGGGGFVISAPLARVLARVLDSCLGRYGHLYGSDARVFACVAELGVGLTAEPGFHQVDIRGDLFGMLSAHPLSLITSVHHIDAVEPIFPGMSRINALEHLFKSVRVDPARTFQQTVCYDRGNSLTVSISWGYAVQVYEGNRQLPEVLALQRTFKPWKRGKNVSSTRFMFNTRQLPSDPCKRPIVFYMKSVDADPSGVWTNYTRHNASKCSRTRPIQKLKVISVLSQNLEYDVEEMKAPRRQCCDISSSSDERMTIQIRKCGVDELIAMQG